MARAMGIDPATKQYVKFDIVNPRFAENYFKILHHPLEQQGIDFFWLDWQQEGTTGLAGLNPTFWLNYVHSTDMERRGKRPLIYHRWGGLGNHRYQIGFSGDTISTWESLTFQPYFTATAANVGYGYWSHDIGGHMPGKVDPEMYTRWVQFGAFSPDPAHALDQESRSRAPHLGVSSEILRRDAPGRAAALRDDSLHLYGGARGL